MANATMSTAQLQTNSCFSLAPRPRHHLADCGATGDATADSKTVLDRLAAQVVPRMVPKFQAAAGAVQSVITNWLGFFGSLNVPIVDTSILPNIKLYLTWAPNSIHASAGALTYTLSGLYATITAHSSPAYASSLLATISEGITIRYTYDRFHNHAFTEADGAAVEH